MNIRKEKCTILLTAVLFWGLSACGKQNPNNLTESEIIETTESESQQTDVEEAKLPDADRVIDNQTFDVTLEGWGDVIFASYKPATEGGDAEYKLIQNNEVVYTFESWIEEYYKQTKAVAFKDYNMDGYQDAIIIGSYGQTSEVYDVARVFIQNPKEKTFEIDNFLCEWLLKQYYTDSIATIMDAREEYLASQTWFPRSNISYAESKLMTDEKDMWLIFMDYANDVEQYVVTDLDKNGRAELIISSMGGTGAYTYSRIFEVNEAHDGLEEVTTDFIEGDSQPDIISFDKPVTVYIDQDFVHHYIVEDFLKVTPAEYNTVIYDLTLQDGQLSHRALASKSESYNTEGGVTVKYEDANRAEITEEAYQAIAETVFADANRKEQYIWGWQDLKELKGLHDEEIRQKLDESYCKWEEAWE